MHDAALTLFGIKACDTVKKARVWLDAAGVGYAFHDFKTAGTDPARLVTWMEQLGWEAVLNRAGTTFRKLPDSEKQGLDAARALALMLAQPSMIKRPVLEGWYRESPILLAGFKSEIYAAHFA